MKDFIELFKELPVFNSLIVISTILGLILPGFIFIYEFNPLLFSGELLKTLLLGSSICFSLQLILWFAFSFYFRERVYNVLELTEKTVWRAILFSGLICAIEVLLISFIKMWVGPCFKTRLAISILTGINILLLWDSYRDFKGIGREIALEDVTKD